MLAEDVAPNRLEKSKQLISQIINSLGNDRIGIIGYAGSAYPVLPMTTDYSIAKMYLQNMNTDMVSSQGTALNDAINMATNYFDAVDTSKLIILVSDGEDHGEGAEQASEIAKEKGIKIITIGVGTEKGGPIPIKDRNGRITEYKKDNTGETVITQLHPETLQAIAEDANGGYIPGTATKEVVEQIKNALDNIEKTEFETQQIAEYQTQYQWFVGIAFVLLLLDIFFLERKTSWLQKLNLFNER
jgi:Ca-activated chloride channel family protein